MVDIKCHSTSSPMRQETCDLPIKKKIKNINMNTIAAKNSCKGGLGTECKQYNGGWLNDRVFKPRCMIGMHRFRVS